MAPKQNLVTLEFVKHPVDVVLENWEKRGLPPVKEMKRGVDMMGGFCAAVNRINELT